MTLIAETLLARTGLQVSPELSLRMRDMIQRIGDPVPLGRLDGAKPILLVPLRLETRFRGNSLWIRAFPDAISIDQHQPLLTEREHDEGAAYVAAVGGDPTGAWAALLAGRSPERAAWIARACDAATGAADPGERVKQPIARPVARGLPERLAFVLVSELPDPATGQARVRTVLGAPIPDPLPIGPDPSAPAKSLFSDTQTKRLDLVGDLEWLAKPEVAKGVGMAVEIGDLDDFELKGGFATVTALGVRMAGDATSQAGVLHALLDAHRYGDGLSIVRQGTATNSSTDPGASRPQPLPPVALDAGDPDAPRFYDLENDGERLARALGLPRGAIAGIANADAEDGAEAIAMARALWSPTLGYFLSTMVDPLLDPATIDKVRDVFTYHVGTPLSAIRIGDQPYGILPATRFEGLAFAGRGWDFHAGLQTILWSAKRAWDGRTDELPRVGADNDPDATILGILRQYPASIRFAQTRLVGPDFREAALRLLNRTDNQILMEQIGDGIASLAAAMNANCVIPGDHFRPEMKIFQLAERWRSDLNALLDGAAVEEKVPLSEVQPIGPLGGLGQNYIDWLLNAAPADVIAERILAPDGTAVAPPRALLYMLLRHAWQLEHAIGTARATAVQGQIRMADLLVEKETISLAEATAPQFIQLLGTPLGIANAPDVNLPELMADRDNRPRTTDRIDLDYRGGWAKVVDQIDLGRFLPELVGTAGVRQYFDGLARLAKLPTARLERLFAERIDACAYRIDAWMTGLVSLKLLSLRTGDDTRRLGATQLGYEPERGGLYLGAYGRLENLKPRTRNRVRQDQMPDILREGDGDVFIDPASQGHVHAPSLNHAATAAILKSGERSHRGSATSPFRINLSSRRVRVATWLCEGIRNGQPLGALLGYLFERALHDRDNDLDQYLLAIRRAFPTYVEEEAQQLEGVAIEDERPRNVVDGLRMVEAKKDGSLGPILQIVAADAGDRAILSGIVDDLVDAVDAVADLTLAESVHQLAAGNIDKAAGVLDAAALAIHVPQQFDVAETPITGRSCSHRIGVLFDDGADDTSPWSGGDPVTPRGLIDPVMNRWIGRIFGDPATVGARVIFTVDGADVIGDVPTADLGLEPADLMLLLSDESATGLSELAARFAHRAIARDGGTAAAIRSVSLEEAGALRSLSDWTLVAGAMRSLLLGRRPLGARDFGPPGGADTDSPDNYDGVELATRHAALLAALDAAIADLTAARDAADPAGMTAARERLALFGVADALPPLPGVAASDPVEAAGELLRSVAARRARAAAIIADPALAGDRRAGALIDTIRVLLGGAAVVTPRFLPTSPDLSGQVVRGGIVPAAADPLAVDPVQSWLIGLSVVRPAVAALLDTRLASEAGEPFGQMPVFQLPVPPDSATSQWCALPWPEKEPPEEIGSLAAMAMVCPEPVSPDGPWRGILIDSWVETVPDVIQTSGLAFNFDAPASEPPQALILAVAPGDSWSWSDLLGTVEETFDAARRRLVVPSIREDAAQDPDAEYDAASMIAPLLPAILSPLSARPTSLSLDYLALASDAALTSVSHFKDLG